MLVSPSAVNHVASVDLPRSPAAADMTVLSVLSKLIEERSWPEALSRLKTHPTEAAQVIKRSFEDVFPLHEACKLQAPADVVEALITAFGPAVRTPACQSAFLPVHFAMQTGSTEALAPLLRAYPAGARKKDDRGRLPIHLGCEWEAPAEAIKALLTLYPESIFVRDVDGKSPMDYAMKSKMGGDVCETVAILKNGPSYCAVSKSAYSRLKDEFDILMKNQVKAHEAQVAELKNNHTHEVEFHRQLEDGYRSGLKSMGEQSNKLRKECRSLKKENTNMQEQIKGLQNAESVLQARADTLEKRLQEMTAELQKSRSVGESQKAQIQDLEQRFNTTKTTLSERNTQLDHTMKELCEEKQKVKYLICEHTSQASLIKELVGSVNLLKTQLKESRDESKEKGSSLQEAENRIEVLDADIAKKERHISELNDNVTKVEAQLKDRCAEIEAKNATIESNHEHIDVLSFNLESMNKLSNEQAKQISSLISHTGVTEEQLMKKSASLKETSAALSEAKGRMEVLLRNLETVLRHNARQFERIERLNKTVVSLSASVNAFILPHEIVDKARAEQNKALGLILDKNDNSLLQGKIFDWRESIATANQAMEKSICSANPIELDGVTWEHFVPRTGESTIGTANQIDFASLEEKERSLAELIVTSTASTLADVPTMGFSMKPDRSGKVAGEDMAAKEIQRAVCETATSENKDECENGSEMVMMESE